MDNADAASEDVDEFYWRHIGKAPRPIQREVFPVQK